MLPRSPGILLLSTVKPGQIQIYTSSTNTNIIVTKQVHIQIHETSTNTNICHTALLLITCVCPNPCADTDRCSTQPSCTPCNGELLLPLFQLLLLFQFILLSLLLPTCRPWPPAPAPPWWCTTSRTCPDPAAWGSRLHTLCCRSWTWSSGSCCSTRWWSQAGVRSWWCTWYEDWKKAGGGGHQQ